MSCEQELIATYPTLDMCEKNMEAQYEKIKSGGVGCIPVEKIEA